MPNNLNYPGVADFSLCVFWFLGILIVFLPGQDMSQRLAGLSCSTLSLVAIVSRFWYYNR
jgi:hypothetical protein